MKSNLVNVLKDPLTAKRIRRVIAIRRMIRSITQGKPSDEELESRIKQHFQKHPDIQKVMLDDAVTVKYLQQKLSSRAG
jgi:hypothetical protein